MVELECLSGSPPPQLRSGVQGGGAAAPPRWGREGRRPVGLGRGGAHPLGHKRAQPFHRGTRLSAVAMVTGWPGRGRGPPAPAAPVLTGRVWRGYSPTCASSLWNKGVCQGCPHVGSIGLPLQHLKTKGRYVHGGSAVEPIAGSQLRAERGGRAWLFSGTPLPSLPLPCPLF